jgi:hypothetical protein
MGLVTDNPWCPILQIVKVKTKAWGGSNPWGSARSSIGRCSVICDYDNDKRISYRMDFLKNKARTMFHL